MTLEDIILSATSQRQMATARFHSEESPGEVKRVETGRVGVVGGRGKESSSGGVGFRRGNEESSGGLSHDGVNTRSAAGQST